MALRLSETRRFAVWEAEPPPHTPAPAAARTPTLAAAAVEPPSLNAAAGAAAVPTAAAAGAAPTAVGQAVLAKWLDGDQDMYPGTVTKIDAAAGTFEVWFDEGVAQEGLTSAHCHVRDPALDEQREREEEAAAAAATTAAATAALDVEAAFGDLLASPSGGASATSAGSEMARIGRVKSPSREVKVLVTTDDSVFVEELDGSGTRTWLPISELEGAPEVGGGDWRASVGALLDSLSGADGEPASSSSSSPADPANPAAGPLPSSLAEPWQPGAPVVFRGLLDASDRGSIAATASSCFNEGWGTVRRRSVGMPEAQYLTTPSQTHLRLTRRFRELSVRAWARIRDAAAHADGVLGTGLGGMVKAGEGDETPLLEGSFKQADFLYYDGAGRDWVGWHDHAGESVIFIVVLVADGFEGGQFMYRDMETSKEVAVELRPGDAVVCPSPMEHCVRPLTSGSRVSMNIDFWNVDMQHDSRSLVNRY